jgi:hypothetical protein
MSHCIDCLSGIRIDEFIKSCFLESDLDLSPCFRQIGQYRFDSVRDSVAGMEKDNAGWNPKKVAHDLT